MSEKALGHLPSGARVLVAMSGGLDSSMAAYRLVKAGFEVVGVTMHLIDRGGPGADDAKRFAGALGIEHHLMYLADLFEERVAAPTREQYAQGRTPNPCILCNRYMKFDVLVDRAEELRCSHIATGHYARVARDLNGWHLLRGVDSEKEQSYFLAYLTERELRKTVFPLGWDTKEEVRKEAKASGIDIADRPESQDLCFFAGGESGLDPALAFWAGREPGEIVKTDGTVIGRHDGIAGYTRGQRKGLPGGQPEALYVVDIDAGSNRVIVGTGSECFASRFMVRDASLVSREGGRERLGDDIDVQVRYRTRPTRGLVTLGDGGSAKVELREPVRAVCPGQAAVWYADEEVLGAGIIWSVEG